jgi:antitoxin YefM
MDQVNDDHEPVIVTRAKGKPVVMVSLEDWASMDETAYLLSGPENARRLRESIRQLNEARAWSAIRSRNETVSGGSARIGRVNVC